jgi:O-antigen ligase
MTSTIPPTALRTGTAWVPGVAALGLIAAVAGLAGGPSWILLPILGVLGTVVAVLAPGVFFAAYLLLVFYKAAVQTYSPLDVTVLLAVLTTLQIVPVLMGRLPRVSRAGIVLWLTMTSLILAGVLYAVDQDLALGSAANWCALVFAPLLAGALRVGSDPRFIRQFLWSLMAFGVLTTILGLTLLSSTERLAFLGSNTIQAGRAVLLLPLIGVTFVLHQRGLVGRAITIALIPAALVVAFATGSRGPLLALVIVGLLALIRYLSRPHSLDRRLVGVAASLAVASVVVASFVAPALPGDSTRRFAVFGDLVQSALFGDFGTSTADGSAGARVTLFRAALSMFGERPILGYGTAGFRASSHRFLSPSELEAWPHNAVLQFAAEYGLVGVALFVGLVALALTRRLPRDTSGGPVRVVLVFFLLNAMVSGDILTDRLTWGLLLLILLIDVPVARPHVVPSAPPLPARLGPS